MSLKTIFREKELWLLVLLGILYFHRPLFGGETFFFRDLFSIFLTQKQLLTDFMRAGELPLWDPYIHGGRPYLANALNSVFYPSNLLYVFLPFFKAFNVNIVLHFICYPVCAYLFARIIGLQPISSFVVGIVYGFCGYTLSLINLLNMFLAMTHLPLLLLCWHLCLLRRKRIWFVITVLIGVVQVCAGSPEINVISLGLLLGWCLSYPYDHIPLRRKIALWLLLGIFITGIASVQLFPLGEMLAQSSRGEGMSYATWSKWSLDPRRLPELLFPEFSGHVGAINWAQQYWGSKVFSEGVPLILSIYFGWISIALSIVGGLHRGDRNSLPFKVRIFLLFVIAFSLLLSLGRFLPFFHLLYQHIPLMTLFRYPIKFLSAGIFPFALLVGYAAEVHFGPFDRLRTGPFDGVYPEQSRRAQGNGHGGRNRIIKPVASINSRSDHCLPGRDERRVNFLGILWGIAIILILFTLLFLFSDAFAGRFQELLFKQSGGDVMRHGIGASLIHASAVWLALTLLYQYRRLGRRPWHSWILVCILLVDLLSAGKRVNQYAPENFFTDVPDVVQAARQEIGDGRLFRTQNPPLTFNLNILPDDVRWMYRWTLEVLDNTVAAFFRLPVIFHTDFDRLASVPIMHLKTLIESLPWKQRLPLLSAGGVTLIMTSDEVALPEMDRIGEIPNWSTTRLYLYRNNTAAARVEFVTGWKEVNSDADALGSMLAPRYDPRKHVILQKPKSTFALLFSRKPLQGEYVTIPINKQQTGDFQDAELNLDTCSPTQIKKITADMRSAVFSVSNRCDGYLVFSEPFYPGWNVSIDGKPTSVLRANYAFSAIFLRAGDHEVQRVYHPTSLLLGALSSVVFFSGLLLVTYKGWVLKIDSSNPE